MTVFAIDPALPCESVLMFNIQFHFLSNNDPSLPSENVRTATYKFGGDILQTFTTHGITDYYKILTLPRMTTV